MLVVTGEPVNSVALHPGKQIPQLDGLRGLAILLVTVYRFGRDIPESHAGVILAQAIDVGTHGVELFFVLSGFLITGILLDSRGQPHQLRNFFARRSLRILPLYFAALILCLWCLPALASLTGSSAIATAFEPAREQQLYLWLYLTNVQMSLADAWCFGPLDHFWSLAVEEHFYLLWPLVVVCFRARWLILSTIFLATACVASRTAWLALGGSSTAAEVLTIWRCDGLLIGALAAMLIRSPSAAWHNIAWASKWIWCPLLVMALALDATDRRIWLVNLTLWNVVWFCLLVNLVNSLSCQNAARKLQGRLLTWFFQLAWLRGLGKLSYGMYVFQAPLIPVVAAMGWTAGVSLPLDLLYVGCMFALTAGIAWCSWHGFEKHWLQLKMYFPQSDSMPVERGDMSGPESVWERVVPTPEHVVAR